MAHICVKESWMTVEKSHFANHWLSCKKVLFVMLFCQKNSSSKSLHGRVQSRGRETFRTRIMLYGPNRCQWWIPQAASLIRYWKARAFCAVISAWWVKTNHQACRFWNEKMPKETHRFYFLSCYHERSQSCWAVKPCCFLKPQIKWSETRLWGLGFFSFLSFFFFFIAPLVLYSFGVSSEMYIHWVWFFFFFFPPEGVEHFHPLHRSHTSGCVKGTEGL